jgi:hypothetical protein
MRPSVRMYMTTLVRQTLVLLQLEESMLRAANSGIEGILA